MKNGNQAMPRNAADRHFTTFELVLLGMLAALVVAANIALRFPIKMPGRSGLVSVALLITAAAVVPKRGAVTCVGFLSGLIAVFAGVGDRGAIVTLLSYTAAGLGVEAVLFFSRPAPGATATILAGICGNLSKLGMKTLLEFLIGVPPGFLVLGRAYSLLTYIVFGALGGFLGYAVVHALRRAGYFTYLEGRR
jgi:hypothetical protein